MATKKKLTAEDFTTAPQATTAAEVNDQDARTRLWQSLDYTYGQQRKDSAEQYAKAYAQADRQALSRGMQRSSYNNQTLANIAQKGIEANNDIYNAQIADYQNRIGEIERQEKEDERWERQFAENVRQFNEGQEFTRSENALNRAFQTSEREAQQGWQAGENALNRSFQTSEREAQQAYSTAEREAQQAWQSSENALSREQADRQWQMEYDEKLRQFNEQMAYQRERSKVSDEQWQKEYEEKLRQFNESMAFEKQQWNWQVEQAEAAAAAAAAAAASSGRSGYTKDDKGKDDNKEGLTDKSFLDSLGKVFDNPSKAVLTSALVNKWPPSAP